jgi:uncharacterized PurR-regulated membrane protein YhhQ (DUF165 family)
MKVLLLVFAYVGAAVAANVTIAHFGPSATIWVAFLLIGLTITVRDKIHDRWQGIELAARMLVLICGAAVISYTFAPDAGRVGIASMLAFIASETVDTYVYDKLYQHQWLVRANASNTCASIVDSLVFPTIAFGSFIPWVVAGQFIAKTLGGYIWSLFLQPSKATDDQRPY